MTPPITPNDPATPFGATATEPTTSHAQSSTRPGGGAAVSDPVEILRGFGNTTSRVVEQAASILEEEIAAGILAAKQVEERLIDVKEARAGKPDEVMQRFRRDAHDVVDILLDLVSVATKSLGGIAQRVISIRTSDGRGAGSASGALATGETPTLTMPQAVKAGELATAPMTLENDSDSQVVHFSFRCSDLVSDAGDRIASAQVTTVPLTLTINPRQTEQVIVTVDVPAGTPPGSYAGLLQATNLHTLRAVLVVQVV